MSETRALLHRERYEVADENKIVMPLLTVWCAVHRVQLAWETVSIAVVEVKHCFQRLISISSFFHTSAVQTCELKKLALDQNLAYLHCHLSPVKQRSFTR